jgi:hypothetical protein
VQQWFREVAMLERLARGQGTSDRT